MVALSSGKPRSRPPAVNVSSKLDSLCTILPRQPTQSEVEYKGLYSLKLEIVIHAGVDTNENGPSDSWWILTQTGQGGDVE